MSRESIEELRAEIERVRRGGGSPRYGRSLRELALRLLAERQGRGETVWKVSAELGLPWQTLRRWELAGSAAGAKSTEGAFRRVRVVDEARGANSQSFVVQGPTGLQISGLTVAELAALWRALLS